MISKKLITVTLAVVFAAASATEQGDRFTPGSRPGSPIVDVAGTTKLPLLRGSCSFVGAEVSG